MVDANVNMTRLPPRLSLFPVFSVTDRGKLCNQAYNANSSPPMVQLQLTFPIPYFYSERKCSWCTKLFLASQLILFLLPHMLLQNSSQLSPSPVIFILPLLELLFNSPLCLSIHYMYNSTITLTQTCHSYSFNTYLLNAYSILGK